MAKRRTQNFRSVLITGTRGQIDPATLKRKDVREAFKAVHLARRSHFSRLHIASLGYPTNIMETRRTLIEAEKRYRELTGEDCP